MKLRTLALILAIFALVSQTFTQTPAKSPEDTEKEKELRANAFTLLREAAGEADLLRHPVNRLSARMEIAKYLSVVDVTEAMAMFRKVMDDFENQFAPLDAKFALLKIGPDEYNMQNDSFGGELDERAEFLIEFSGMLDLRRRIAYSVSTVDGAEAFEFCDRTAAMITDPKRNRDLTEKDRSFKVSLLRNLVAKNPEKAVRLARKTFTGGVVDRAYFELARSIYAVDAELGAAFMNELIGKVREAGVDKVDFIAFVPWLTDNTQAETTAGKPPLIDDGGRRILAEITADSILALEVSSGRYRAEMAVGAIEQYAPAKSAQIRKRFGLSKSKTETNGIPTEAEIRRAMSDDSTPNGPGNPKPSPSPAPETSKESPAQRFAVEREQLMKLTNRSQRLRGLVKLAISAATEDKKAALAILGDARSLVADTPTKIGDYTDLSNIAAGYAELDPDKSFEIFDSMIPRLNRVIEALITFGEFMDQIESDIAADEINMRDGEYSIMSGIKNSTGPMLPTFRKLAAVDFGRTRALTEKFDRREFRIFSKMMIAAAILAAEQEMKGI